MNFLHIKYLIKQQGIFPHKEFVRSHTGFLQTLIIVLLILFEKKWNIKHSYINILFIYQCVNTMTSLFLPT